MKALLSFILLLFGATTLSAQAIKVEVVQQDGQWQMLRDGAPYFVKGGGGQDHLEKLVAIGGNSFRTWGPEKAQEQLDEAEKLGLTVMLGLWVQHERHGFDYDDKIAIRKQLEGFKKTIDRFKDHPALLCWGIGNEVDLNYTNTNVWYAIQDIAAYAHKVDPNHPTCTVTAGLDASEVKLVLERCPDLDIYGVNTYGDIGNVAGNIQAFGWKGPYMITEWGVNGHWESPNTEFGVPVEQTSHEKAKSFEKRYQMILSDSQYCVGSYAFLWGQKQETTATWYGLFTPDGKASEAIDILQKEFSGTAAPAAPILESLTIEGKTALENIYLISGDKMSANVTVTDPNGDDLKIVWQIIPESTDKKSGGDKEDAPTPLSGLISKRKDDNLWFRAPKEEGVYRLFVYAFDGNGNFGAANTPFYVLPRPADAQQARGVELKTRELDLPQRY